jgi:hypothetical protein
MKRYILIAALALQGCALTPPDLCEAGYGHLSHPTRGHPFFGPVTEEGTIDMAGPSCRWVRGRMFIESGLFYKFPDSDLYGNDLLYSGRVGFVFWKRGE